MICTWWGHSPSSQPLKVWWLRSGVESFALHFNTRCVDPLKGSSSWPWKPRAQSFEGFGRVCHYTKVVDYVDWSFEGIHICKETIDSKYWSLGQTCWEACFQFSVNAKGCWCDLPFLSPTLKPLVLGSGVESLASDLNSRLILWRNGALYQKSLGSCLAVNVKTVDAVCVNCCVASFEGMIPFIKESLGYYQSM